MPTDTRKHGSRPSDEELARIGLRLLRIAMASPREAELTIDDVESGINKVVEILCLYIERPLSVESPNVEEFLAYFQRNSLESTAQWLFKQVTGRELPESFYSYFMETEHMLWFVERAGTYLGCGCHEAKSCRYDGVFGELIRKLEKQILKDINYSLGLATVEEREEFLSEPPKLRRAEAFGADNSWSSCLERQVVELLDLREYNINRARPLERLFFVSVAEDPYIRFLSESEAQAIEMRRAECCSIPADDDSLTAPATSLRLST